MINNAKGTIQQEKSHKLYKNKTGRSIINKKQTNI